MEGYEKLIEGVPPPHTAFARCPMRCTSGKLDGFQAMCLFMIDDNKQVYMVNEATGENLGYVERIE